MRKILRTAKWIFFEKRNICILLEKPCHNTFERCLQKRAEIASLCGNSNHPRMSSILLKKKYDFPSWDFRKTSWIGLVKYLGSKEGFRAEHAM